MKPPSDLATSSVRALQIAHVLFMDIVAYSQLPMDEQTRLIELLQQIVRSTTEFSQAQKHRQLLRLPTGDGMALVFFGDAIAPVRCALEVSRALSEQAAMRVRMGIHSGPVQRVEDINTNRNVAGGGINLAQRVMDCGDEGHILVSKSVADVLSQMSNWKAALHDLGEVQVKHGVTIHIYNLYTDDAGKRELPQKLVLAEQAALRAKRKKVTLMMVAGGVLVLLVAGYFSYFREHHTSKLTEKDSIVLAKFTNTTGDPVFDDTLQRALAVDLAQSPFLNILSEAQVRQTLRQMTRSPDEPLTNDLATEVCQRAGGKVYLAGSVATLGTQYVISLEAVSCESGDVLAREQITAAGKERVLAALGEAAAKLRNEVGESLSSVQRFDVPLAQATTDSLEALKAHSVALRIFHEKGNAEAIPFEKHAIELDPKFSEAYSALGIDYYNLNQPSLAADCFRKAFELRDRATERERFHIAALYYESATGELEKANQNYEMWIQTYPRDSWPHAELGSDYMALGQYDKAEFEVREGLRLESSWTQYANLALIYLALNRLDDSRAEVEQAMSRKFDGVGLHLDLYALAFLQGDAAAMKSQSDWALSNPGAQDQALSLESDTEAWFGKLRKARELSRQAVENARSSDEKEPAALWQANAAIREALFGNTRVGRENAAGVTPLAPGSRDAEAQATLAYALLGDTAHAQALAGDLSMRFPQDTIMQRVWLPTIRSQIELTRNNPASSIELLRSAAPFELGMLTGSGINSCLYPVYVRAEAYLKSRQAAYAREEFQKLLGHRGLMWNCVTGPLSKLGLARAYALEGNTAEARAVYQEFLTLWKDADPDIPVLKQAKAEFARLL